MKKILAGLGIASLAVSAQAADLPVKAPYLKAPKVMVYDWTGFYFGANAGVGLGRDRTTFNVSNPPVTAIAEQSYLAPQGLLGGGQIGYNKQYNKALFGSDLVLGVEADIQGTGMQDKYTCLLTCSLPVGANQYNQKLDWFGTVRGRIGMATGPVLTYVTGGYAYGGVNTTLTETLNSAPTVFSLNQSHGGYVLGSGIEASLGGNWTGKIEYLYLNLGNRTDMIGFSVLPASLDSQIRENIFRVGVNYKVGDAKAAYVPPPARNWVGFYLGGDAGSGTARDRTATTISQAGAVVPELLFLSPDGIVGGIYGGYNWQSMNWVYGLEADIQGSTQRDNRACILTCNISALPTYLSYDAKLPWFGTLRGRLGYSLGSTLFYGTGGVAYGGVKTKATLSFNGNALGTGEISETRVGWTVGGGIETPFTLLGLFGPNWTSKTEYLYVDLGTTKGSALFPASANIGGDFTITPNTHVTEHIFTTGLAYHFNSAVVAKY